MGKKTSKRPKPPRQMLLDMANRELLRRGLNQNGSLRAIAAKLGWTGRGKTEAWKFLIKLLDFNGLSVKAKARKPVKVAGKKSFAAFKAFYQTKEWRKLRFEALLLYGRKCMCCNATDAVMHVDHVKPRFKYPELELDIANLQILCEDCNMGKGGWSEADFREEPIAANDVGAELDAEYRERMRGN